MRFSWRAGSLFFVCVLTTPSCVGTAEVRAGPAYAQKPVTVVITPAACGSVEDLCTDAIVEGTNAFVANELRFAGFTVVDAVKLAQEARTRPTADDNVKRFGESVLRAANARQHGQIFRDLSPSARHALIHDAKADGLVTIGVQIGTPDGIGPGRTHQVVVRLGAGDEDELVWVSRCTAESSVYPDIEQAVDNAARCAMDGALRRQPQPTGPPK